MRPPLTTLSLNEVESTVAKAARGCGIDHGIGVEIGASARWLCERGHDGVSAAAEALDVAQVSNLSRLGLAAVDQAVASGESVEVIGCSSLPLLTALAARARCSVTVESGRALVVPEPALDDPGRSVVTVPVSPHWDRIVAWSKQTHVPSSAHSRIAGAGAGLTDND